MKKAVKRWIALTLGFITSLVIAYCAGTFQPNWLVLEELNAQAMAQQRSDYAQLGLEKPSIEYNNGEEFVLAVNRCIQWHNLSIEPNQRIPREIIIAMAVLETGWGESRFAKEGNNLFGIRTWDPNTPQLKAKGNPNAPWGVKSYETKCDSVIDMIYTVNTHHAYEGYREERIKQGHTTDINKLIDELHKWSTNDKYVDLVKSKVVDITKILQEQ